MPNDDCESSGHAHGKTLKCVSKSEKYLFVVRTFMSPRKLELRVNGIAQVTHCY